MVQLSHLYMTTGKTIALTIQTFVSKVNNTLSRFIIAFLPRSKHLLISWLQSLSAAILEPKKIKSVAVSTFSPTYLPWSDGTGCLGLRFFECWVLSHLFHSPLSPSSTGSLVLLFQPKCGVICISEVIDISPSDLDSSLSFIQSSIFHDEHCI